MSGDQSYIELCMKMIVSKHNLDPEELAERDFEYLNKAIYQKTKTDISTATLRRIWTGKFQKLPQAKTLDALAQFIDFDGWHDFRSNQFVAVEGGAKDGRTVKLVAFVLLLIIAATVLVISSGHSVGKISLTPEVFEHSGVPATIGFRYEIEDPNIQIELSWNPYERETLNENGNFYSGTYFYPDYHQAKLLHENKVLISKSVHVTTPGWHGLLMRSGYDTNPIYLDASDFLGDNKLTVDGEVARKYLKSSLTEYFPVFTFSNRLLKTISGDHFSLKFRLKSGPEIGARICRQTDILIKGEHGSVRIPISQNGCYGTTSLKCSDVLLSGKYNNLSALSADLSEIQDVSVESRDKSLYIKVGQNETFKLNYEAAIGDLKVIKFIFMGSGEVSGLSIKRAGGQLFDFGEILPF